MRFFHMFPIAMVIAAVPGCGEDGSQPTDEHPSKRGDLKADLSGSCVGFCGTMSPDGCWCDDLCTTYNDCCQDKATACPSCKVDCDCPQGQLCAPGGSCVTGFAPAYCCTKPGCQAGWPCTNPDGSSGTCSGTPPPPPPACLVDCDCPQGQLCTPDGSCVTGFAPAYCCTNPGCQAGWPCTNPDGSKGTCGGTSCAPMDATGVPGCQAVLGFAWDGSACVLVSGCGCTGADCGQLYAKLTDCQQAKSACAPPPPPACAVDCDCPQGQLCTADGSCVTGFVPAYCCTKPGCQAGWPCTNPDGSSGSCP